jgi:hypothetical protein
MAEPRANTNSAARYAARGPEVLNNRTDKAAPTMDATTNNVVFHA